MIRVTRRDVILEFLLFFLLNPYGHLVIQPFGMQVDIATSIFTCKFQYSQSRMANPRSWAFSPQWVYAYKIQGENKLPSQNHRQYYVTNVDPVILMGDEGNKSTKTTKC
jgi:hypothetical protein